MDPVGAVPVAMGWPRMSEAVCDAKIRPMTDDSEIPCTYEPGHDGDHRGVIRDRAYIGSATAVSWQENDRRNFHGEWPGRCSNVGHCVLPAGHHGRHAE